MNMTKKTKRCHASSGLSLLEVLIAAALLLTIALAIIPLFLRASQNNLSGIDSSYISETAASNSELYIQEGFNHPNLSIPSGQTELLLREEVWNEGDANVLGDEYWTSATPTPANRFWRRVRVLQYSISDLEDNGLFDSPLDGDTQANFVHVKEVIVESGSALGASAEGRGRRLYAGQFMAF